jgi:hypothetical protein
VTQEIDNLVPEASAQFTLGRVSAGMSSNMVPMIGQILRIIRDISGKSDRMSVADLVEFINGEPTIMARIMVIAGSVGYNSGGIEISSLSQAISLIGFDRVRTLAISILLLESANSEFSSTVNRELAGTSLISGLVAAEMCRRKVTADAELAFICGALRNYGRMLAATFLPKEYAQATAANSPLRPEASFRAHFGLSALELGRQVMTNLQLPKPIVNTLIELSPQDRRFCSGSATEALTGAADFGLRFAEMLLAPDLDHTNHERRLESLSREYDVDFFLTRDEVRELLEYLLGMLDSFRGRAGSYMGSVTMFRRLERLAAGRLVNPALAASIESLPSVRRPPPPPAIPDSYEI